MMASRIGPHLQRGGIRRAVPQLREFVSASSSEKTRGPSEAGSCGTDRRPSAGSGESSSSSASQETPSSTNPTPQVLYGKVSETFRNAASSAASSAGAAFQKVREAKLIDSVRHGYAFLREEMSNTSPRRKAKPSSEEAAADAPPENTSVNAIVPVVKKTTGWEKRWETLKEKARSHPAFKRLRTVTEHPVVTKGQELAEDLRERWETSDSPVVHKIQDLNESLFGETATAVAIREIRRHDPSFTHSEFLAEVQEDIRPVLRAYLKGDLTTLTKKCSREVVERCRAERRALESQGIFMDNKILHISDVEIKETKLLGNSPIIIVAFQTQQIYCVRDKAGNITEGAKDDIHTVFYAWAMQQVSPEEMEAGDYQRRWKLREMQQAGMQAII